MWHKQSARLSAFDTIYRPIYHARLKQREMTESVTKTGTIIA